MDLSHVQPRLSRVDFGPACPVSIRSGRSGRWRSAFATVPDVFIFPRMVGPPRHGGGLVVSPRPEFRTNAVRGSRICSEPWAGTKSGRPRV